MVGEQIIRKLIGLAEIVIAGFFLFVGAKALLSRPETNRQLREAPFVTDGRVDPANEGKTVIVQMNMADMGNAVDDEFGLSFNSPSVLRKVEMLKETSVDSWEWVNVNSWEEFPNEKYFYGPIRSGEYEIDGSLMNSLGVTADLKEADFDPEALEDFLEYYNGLKAVTYKGLFYITDAETAFFEDHKREEGTVDLTAQEYEEREGKLRVRYRGLVWGKYDQVAVVGKQEGNRLVKDDRVDTITAYENVQDVEKLIGKSNMMVYGGIALVCIPCLVLLFFRLKRLVTKY